MKKTVSAVCLIAALAAYARGETTAKPECRTKDTVCNYIVATRQLLAGYQADIGGQIAQLQRGYSAIGQVAEQGRRDEVESGLRTERNRRSETMTDDFIHGSRPVWHWKEYLLDYAAQDFKANREFLELSTLDGSRFLVGLKSLEAEFSKVQALDKLLVRLNQKQSLIDSLKELGSNAQETKTQFDALVCAGLKKDLAAKQDAGKAVAKAVADLTAQPQSADRDKQLAQKKGEDQALKDAIAALTKERTAKACKD